MSLLESQLPDDLTSDILSFLNARDLSTMQATSRHFCEFPCDNLWRALGKRRWKPWPLYRVSSEKESSILKQYGSWRRYYAWVEEDVRRTDLTYDCIAKLEWNFNFLPPSWTTTESADPDTKSPAYFMNGQLFITKHLDRFPVLEFELFDEDVIVEPYMEGSLEKALETANCTKAKCSQSQYMDIEGFGLHVARTNDGGWLIWNELGAFFTNGTARHGTPLPSRLIEHLQGMNQLAEEAIGHPLALT